MVVGLALSLTETVSSSELPSSLFEQKAVIRNMCILVWECCTREMIVAL